MPYFDVKLPADSNEETRQLMIRETSRVSRTKLWSDAAAIVAAIAGASIVTVTCMRECAPW